jgi:hypothetical protein
MKNSLILMPLLAGAKKSKCPFGYGGSSDATEESDVLFEHPRVQAGETYLSEIYTCPGGAVSQTPT